MNLVQYLVMTLSTPYVRAWRKRNPEKRRAYNHAYRQRNKEKVRAANKKYRDATVEKRRQYNAQYYKDHPEEYKERLNNWRKENPEKAKIQIHTRRTRKTQAGGSYTTQEWEALCKQQKRKCLCCTKRRRLTPDHVVPVAKGGTSNIDNIQGLCQPCNSRKATRVIDYRTTQETQ